MLDAMKAGYLFKKNVETLLKVRGHTRHDLALYCRRTDAWLSKILGNSDRNLPLKYLDRIADFFGIATYQLFQPGISPLTERRSGSDRRTGADRRLSGRQRELVAPAEHGVLTQDEVEALADLRELTHAQFQRVKAWIAVARFGEGTGRNTPPRGAPQGPGGPATRPGPRRRKERKKPTPTPTNAS